MFEVGGQIIKKLNEIKLMIKLSKEQIEAQANIMKQAFQSFLFNFYKGTDGVVMTKNGKEAIQINSDNINYFKAGYGCALSDYVEMEDTVAVIELGSKKIQEMLDLLAVKEEDK